MIPPGGEGEIQVTLRPKGTHTQISKNIVVISNDPEQPNFSLTMKGSLLVDMIAQPASLLLSDLPPGKPGTETFSLQRTEGSTATVASIRVEDTEHFSIRELEAEPDALATYELRFAGRKEVGVTSTRVVAETTGENTPELVLPVRATVAFNLRYPKQFGFSWRNGRLLDRTIRISTRRGDAPKIVKVVDPSGWLDIEVLEPEGPSVSIRLHVREDAQEKVEEGKPYELVVHTDDRDEPKLVLEYRVMSEQTLPRPKPAARQRSTTIVPP